MKRSRWKPDLYFELCMWFAVRQVRNTKEMPLLEELVQHGALKELTKWVIEAKDAQVPLSQVEDVLVFSVNKLVNCQCCCFCFQWGSGQTTNSASTCC